MTMPPKEDKNLLITILWSLLHPVQTFKIFTCEHRHIDLKTYVCRRCNKQFKFFSVKQYAQMIANAQPKK